MRSQVLLLQAVGPRFSNDCKQFLDKSKRLWGSTFQRCTLYLPRVSFWPFYYSKYLLLSGHLATLNCLTSNNILFFFAVPHQTLKSNSSYINKWKKGPEHDRCWKLEGHSNVVKAFQRFTKELQLNVSYLNEMMKFVVFCRLETKKLASEVFLISWKLNEARRNRLKSKLKQCRCFGSLSFCEKETTITC